MTDLLSQYNLTGLFTGLCTFIIIGVFHPIVIKCHYYFGTRCWWWFLVFGAVCCALSFAVESVMWSTLLGVTAFSSFWTIKEIFEQEQRVAKGWFPDNPRRKSRQKADSEAEHNLGD
ncbi:MAG: DUF4491 family protein [Paramuribaculum sp.]|nr:DUF4491 family protein [Paramuribaculum sp.]